MRNERVKLSDVIPCALAILTWACVPEPDAPDLRAGATSAVEQGRPFEPASEGCPMAHCDPAMSDINPIPAPARRPRVIKHDAETRGSSNGLGCSSNGSTAVCSFGSARPGDEHQPPFVVAYDAAGNRRWTSDDLLLASAFASAPIVDRHGGAIAADDQTIVRFDENGAVLWTQQVAGLPISPVPTRGDSVLVATKEVSKSNFAPVLLYDLRDGDLLGCLRLGVEGSVAGDGKECFEQTSIKAGAFATVNTPGGNGARVYVSTQLVDEHGNAQPLGRLHAIDVDPAAAPGHRLSPAWAFDFIGPSGASPLVIGDIVYFDGERTAGGEEGPFFFAVRDHGDHPELVWSYRLAGRARASAAQDPRGGLWVFGATDTDLIRLAEQPGAGGEAVELQRIDVSELLRGGFPSSAMSITGGARDPVMLVSGTTLQRSYLLAIRLTRGTLQWRVDTGEISLGQFPVLRGDDGASVVAISTSRNGVLFVK